MRKTSLLSALCTVWLLVAPVLAAADGESWLTIAANKPKKKSKAARKKKPAKPAKEAAPAPKTSSRSVQIQIRTGDKPMRFVSVSRMIDGKSLRIESRSDGPIVVTRTDRGKTVTRKFKNADELCKQDAEAFKLYKSIGISAKGISSHVVVGTIRDAKGAVAKAKAAAQCCRNEAESKAKAAAGRSRKEAEAKHRQIGEQRKACEQMHGQRLKQLDQMRARATEHFERAIKSIEVQIKQEQQRHRAAMERLERMQEERR